MFGPCFIMQYLVSCFSLQLPRGLSSCCHVAVRVLDLFFTVPLVGLQCMIRAFPGHTQFSGIRIDLFVGFLKQDILLHILVECS